MTKTRLQDGSVIVEVIDHPENDHVLMTVSKERFDEDAVQVKLSRHVSAALGHILIGQQP